MNEIIGLALGSFVSARARRDTTKLVHSNFRFEQCYRRRAVLSHAKGPWAHRVLAFWHTELGILLEQYVIEECNFTRKPNVDDGIRRALKENMELHDVRIQT
ncbi:hypothetical protein EVAR_34813_1 [Eumeta japonica]|uniref:Uncharacterized protein n=1 Tax=Eumeta variegata TaxID=151549 RepID=A0A4C1WBP4_EUMVA|nr:hypothetical protein EVAR_34813_1 [Eumeta japonica]